MITSGVTLQQSLMVEGPLIKAFQIPSLFPLITRIDTRQLIV